MYCIKENLDLKQNKQTNKQRRQTKQNTNTKKSLTCSRVASFQKFILTRKYFLKISIKNRIVRLQLYSGVHVVVDSIGRDLLIVAVEVTLSSFSEILPVRGHGVSVPPSVTSSSKVVVSLSQLAIEAWNCAV